MPLYLLEVQTLAESAWKEKVEMECGKIVKW
jgi:hypothetical protein